MVGLMLLIMKYIKFGQINQQHEKLMTLKRNIQQSVDQEMNNAEDEIRDKLCRKKSHSFQ